MSVQSSTDFIHRLSRGALTLLLGLAIATQAFADEGLETPGVPPGNALPPQAQGNGPPSWTGKAFRQGVVAVSHPLAAEAVGLAEVRVAGEAKMAAGEMISRQTAVDID